MRKIALVNQKGGVGKTTTAVNLSAAIARLDRKVLLIDLDPQSNATISLGIPPHQQQKNTTYALLNGGKFEPIVLSPNLHLVPSNIELAGAEMELTSVIGREIVLRDALSNVTEYDFVILDCSPSLGLLSVNALTFADEVMIPLQCEFLALHGISLLMRTVDLVKKRLHPGLSITGVIPCMYDVRKGLARDVVTEIEKHFGSKVFRTKIRANVRLAEAPSHGKSIFDYAPDSYGAEDYLALAREIVGIEAIAPAPVVETAAATEASLAAIAELAPELQSEMAPPPMGEAPQNPLPPQDFTTPSAEATQSFAPESAQAEAVAVLEAPPIVELQSAVAPLPSAEAPTAEAPLQSAEAVAAPVIEMVAPIVDAPPLPTVEIVQEAAPQIEPTPVPEPLPVIDAPPAVEAVAVPQPAEAPSAEAPLQQAQAEAAVAPFPPADAVVEFIELVPLDLDSIPYLDVEGPPPQQS